MSTFNWSRTYWQYKNGNFALLDKATARDILLFQDGYYSAYDHSLGAYILYDANA